MKKYIKEQILFTARTLFNQYGYNQVSLRDIADVLDISVGNLTYHFKRKEDIVEGLVIEHYDNYIPFKTPTNFNELHNFFHHIEDHHDINAYYYRHFVQLGSLSKKIHSVQVKIQTDIYRTFHDAFEIFQEKELIRHEQHKNQYDSLIQMLMANNIFGAPDTGAYVNENLIDMYWDVLHLVFTDAGKAEYNKTFKKTNKPKTE